VENSYATFIHEAPPEMEKLSNGEKNNFSGGVEVENPHQSEKSLKRSNEDVIDLEEEIDISSKRTKLFEGGSSSYVSGFQLQLGELICTPSSPIPE